MVKEISYDKPIIFTYENKRNGENNVRDVLKSVEESLIASKIKYKVPSDYFREEIKSDRFVKMAGKSEKRKTEKINKINSVKIQKKKKKEKELIEKVVKKEKTKTMKEVVKDLGDKYRGKID